MRFEESSTVELKEQYVEDIRKEVVAFANSSGGTIYVGVADTGETVGVNSPDQVSLQIINSCRDSIRPDVTMFLACDVEEADGRKIVAVRVQKGTERPYYLAAKGMRPSGVYVRQGSSSAPASESAIRRMIRETDGDRFEDMRSLNQDLTFAEAEKAFAMRDLQLKSVQMRTLGMINEQGLYTNLALLLSDQCPHMIKAAAFRGIGQEEFQDRKEYTGSILKQLNDAYSYLDMHNRTRAAFKGLYRTDTRDYSEEALREALLNAIEHRDYSFSAATLISIYDDRVEMVSYGGLAGEVTLQDVLYGLSVCRNPKLADVFYRLKLIEAYGTGLKKIRDAYRNSARKPEFMAGPGSFKVILPNMNADAAGTAGSRKTDHEKAENGEGEKVLAYIAANTCVSRSQIEAHFTLSTSGTIRILKTLRETGKITVVGKGKNIQYKAK